MLALIPLFSFLLTPSFALSPLRIQKEGTSQVVFDSPPIESAVENVEPARVPVLLGVMSKCPDAIFCEGFFDKVLKKVGHDKVDLKLSFIGRYVVSSLFRMVLSRVETGILLGTVLLIKILPF